MRRPSALPVMIQVAALAAFAIVLSHAVAFGVLALSPEPRPAGFSIEAAAQALEGAPAETADGRTLRRRLSDAPIEPRDPQAINPLALAIRSGLARSLGVTPDRVAVVIQQPARRPGVRPLTWRSRGAGAEQEESSFIFVRRADDVVTTLPPAPGSPPPEPLLRLETEVQALHSSGSRTGPGPTVIDSGARHFSIVTERLTFDPFSASLRLDDGRWATVEPPRGLLSPWQRQMLLALVLSMLLLAPVVWWMARRLTRPIRVFAEAAERLGANPETAPMAPSGPSEVRTAIHAFNDMQGSLRRHMRQRTQTVAAIAHDLRTPLTRLRFRAEQAPEAVRDRMAADIEEMDALIGQAMAFVRGETATEHRERFDLDTLAADCASGFAETGESVAFDGGVPLPVHADPTALRRALGNLIANAVQYGGAARVRTFIEIGRAIVTVEDDGPGLSAEELEVVFEPFHRGERSRSRETGGAGLGLTVARQAARAAGGEVILTNRPGGGLTARLSLPLEPKSKETS